MTRLLLLLPVAAFHGMFLAWGRWRPVRDDPRPRLLLCTLTWLLALWGMTEVLSLGRLLTRAGVALGWGLLALALLVARRVRRASGARAPAPGAVKAPTAPAGHALPILVACVALVLLPALLASLYAPPNNADLVEYHLPRVMHWAQHRSVAHYPTSIERQLRFGPLMEYLLLHAYLLWGDDRAVNPLGWLVTAGATLFASLLARELGAGRGGQAMGALLAASAPMTILQASCGKNDALLALCLLAFSCLVCLYRRRPDPVMALAAGAALGLGLLVKGTAYLFAPALLVWALLFARSRLRGRLLHALAAGVLVLALNAGFWWRNYDTFGDWLGNARHDCGEFAPGLYSAASLVSGVTRNLSLHLMANYNAALNPLLASTVRALHAWIGLSSCDPRTSVTPFFCAAFSWRHWDEGESGNFVVALLTLGLLPAAVALLLRGRARPWCGLILAVAAAFITFSFLLKFQQLHVRLHQPLCFLAAACAGAALGDGEFNPGRDRLLAALGLLLTALALPVHLYHRNRPLLGPHSVLVLPREQAFVTGSHADLTPCLQAAGLLRRLGCHDIGLVCDADEDEYFFWVALREQGPRPFRLEHVCVRNASRKHAHRFGLHDFRPQAVLHTYHDGARSLELHGAHYRLAFASRGIRVLVRDDHVHPPVVRLHR